MAIRFLFWTACAFFYLPLMAQVSAYPQQYFRNPLNIPIELSANFGELRSNHWHMGLDMRTNRKENLPVYAAAEGYVAHIGIRPRSFGRFIVINHPNGLSTLYAHLNDFSPALESYVTEQQYRQESWAVELDFTKDQFPVQKGAFIAYSGNTGGSMGPHLHFEIFDTKTTKRLNPLLFGMGVRDNMAPVVSRLALYDRGKTVYGQSPQFFPVQFTANGYVIPKQTVLQTKYNKLSFAIQAYDKATAAGSPNGIFAANLFTDEQPVIRFVLDSIDYEETLYMNSHIDYSHDFKGGAYLQHLSQFPGDKGPVYKLQQGDGVLHLTDTLVHPVRIEVFDAHGNKSVLRFNIQYKEELSRQGSSAASSSRLLAPNAATLIGEKDFELYVPETALYDTVKTFYHRSDVAAASAYSPTHTVNDESIPVHKSLEVRIRPDKPVPEELKNKMLMVKSGKSNLVRKAKWDKDWLTASFRSFGAYRLYADNVPPSINDPGSRKGDTLDLSSQGRILFMPRDNWSVKNFRAELNGQWLRFTNDKGQNWIYKFDERCPYGVHHLKVTVEDLAGNITEKEWWFRRKPYAPPPPKKKAPVKSTTTKKPAAKKN